MWRKTCYSVQICWFTMDSNPSGRALKNALCTVFSWKIHEWFKPSKYGNWRYISRINSIFLNFHSNLLIKSCIEYSNTMHFLSLKSVHFKNTVARSSVLSKLLSFSIIQQLTLFWFQLMLCWNWLQFWKNWGSRNCVFKKDGL